MRGSIWTAESMQDRCSEVSGEVSPNTICSLPSPFAGWCVIQNAESATEANPFALTDGMGCAGIQSMCESMMSGEFVAGSECISDGDDPEITCEIAPGPIGAAHQA